MSAIVIVATACSSVPAAGAGMGRISAAGAVAHAINGSSAMIAKRTYMDPPLVLRGPPQCVWARTVSCAPEQELRQEACHSGRQITPACRQRAGLQTGS